MIDLRTTACAGLLAALTCIAPASSLRAQSAAAPTEAPAPAAPVAPAPAAPAPAANPEAPAAAPAPALAIIPAPPAPPNVTPPQLTLEEAVRRAVARNERSRSADKRIVAAEARVDRAAAFFYPELTAATDYVTTLYEPPWATRFILGGQGVRANLVVNAVLFDGRGIPLLRAAKAERDAQKLESAQEKLLVAYDTASLYLAALGQEAVREAAQARVELAKASAQDAKGRFEAGIVSSNDVTRVQLELSAAERDYAGAVVESGRARLRLAEIIDSEIVGVLAPPEGLLSQALESSGPDAAPLAVAGKESKRLDLKALDKRAEAAEAFAQEPIWRMVPTAGVAFGTYFGNLSFTLTWSLFDGGERYADRDERLALAAVAHLDAEAAARRAGRETREAMLSLSVARELLEGADETVAVARRNRDETAELYRQGLSNAFAVADASAQLFDAEVALARARYGMAVALLDLRRAYGLDPFGKEPVR